MINDTLTFSRHLEMMYLNFIDAVFFPLELEAKFSYDEGELLIRVIK